jgi:hypothetical protein
MLPVKARKSAKKDPDRYLIIGFDSEYQLVVTGDNARLENHIFGVGVHVKRGFDRRNAYKFRSLLPIKPLNDSEVKKIIEA